MKLTDNFQMREYSRPCRFHIRSYVILIYIILGYVYSYVTGSVQTLCQEKVTRFKNDNSSYRKSEIRYIMTFD
jgi:hypothetical protein